MVSGTERKGVLSVSGEVQRPSEPGSTFVEHLTVLLHEGRLSTKELLSFRSQVFQAVRMLNGYIEYLQRRKAEDAD